MRCPVLSRRYFLASAAAGASGLAAGAEPAQRQKYKYIDIHTHVGTFNWGATANNGNLLSLSTTANGYGLYAPVSVAQTYGYDNVNRISSSSETASGSTSWSRRFGYDQFGNMWVTANSGVSLNGLTPTSNIFSNNQASNSTYNAAGNVTVLGPSGTQITYDAENR